MHKKSNNRWAFLGIISLGLFIIAADNSVLYTALPTLRTQLHTTEAQGLWIINIYPLVLAGMLLGTGTLGDKIGHRLMFCVGLVIFGVASLGAAFAPNAESLIAARALLGLGAATMMPATLALIRITFRDPRERNTAIGVWGSVATVGAATGPVLGGALLEHFWWGSVFLINIPIVLIALVATIAMAPPNIADPTRHWDLPSSVYAMVALVGTVLAIKQIGNWRPAIFALAVVLMIVGSMAFVRRQRRIPEPVLRRDVFRERLLVVGFLGASVSMFILAGIEVLTTQRFQLVEGSTPLQAGLITAAIALAAFPSSILGGANLHRVGFAPLIAGGFATITIGLVLSVWGINTSHFGVFLTSMLVAGFGVGMVMSVTSTAIIGSAPASRAGMASALEEVSYELGTLLSVAVLGTLLGSYYSHRAPAEVAHEMDAGVKDAVFGAAARGAVDDAYVFTMLLAAALGLVATVVMGIMLRGNPKETAYAHE